MKRLYINLIITSLVVTGLFSCNPFEDEPLNIISDKEVWASADSLGSNAQAFFYSIYSQLPDLHNRIDNDYLDSGTDDAIPSVLRSDYQNVNAFRKGTITSRNVVDNAWNRNYIGIRRVNVLLANIHRVNFSAALQSNYETWKAEARVLRVFFYFELIKRWGGVPLIGNKIYDTNDKIELERSSIDTCFNYILSELDQVENENHLLEVQYTPARDGNIARVNKGVLKALRARILLYAASPLFNNNNDLIKWEKAALAAKDVIESRNYSLYPDYKTFFTTISNANKEMIFIKETFQNQHVERNNSPTGYQSTSYKGNGYTSPSQNLVDAFLTDEGKLITDLTSGYNPQNPYINRDPRLGFTLFYNGSQWLNRAVETFEGGMDKPNKQFPQTRTGYYMRKFMGPFESSNNFSNTHHSVYLIRYAEILLSYAEALNESDPDGSKTLIEKQIMEIRKRAKIKSGNDNRYGVPQNSTQSEMRNLIRNERRIEMAFEEQRFWDIRRWKIAETVMNQPIKGVEIVKLTNNTYVYTQKNVESSVFNNRMYWFPIPYEEMNANTKMVQNQGWNF